jgi:tetratricopeptide (TPR) repeat protein
VCEPCLLFDGVAGLCPACARRRGALRRWRAAGWQTLGAVAAALTLCAIAFLASHGHRRRLLTPEQIAFRRLVDAQHEKPCDPDLARLLGEALLRVKDAERASALVDDFGHRCAPLRQLQGIAFQARLDLGRFVDAQQLASRLLDEDPNDVSARWWRGLAFERLGEWSRAEADYREALRRQPRLERVPFNLIDVLEHLGRSCEGAPVLATYLANYPEAERAPLVLGRVRHLRELGCPSAPTASGDQL